MNRKLRFSAPFRKSRATALALVKRFIRAASSEYDYMDRPPVVVNSLPKSGTHLLLQVVCGIPGYRNYGGFIATTPSLTMCRRSDKAMTRMIMRLVPGEVCGAHIYYSRAVSEALRERGAVSLFIHRDPRDVFWSEMQYLLKMNRWHRAGRYARRIDDLDKRFEFFLRGKVNDNPLRFSWANFSNRVQPYMGWLADENTYCCKFEDFAMPDRLPESINALAIQLRRKIRIAERFSQADIECRFRRAVRPQESHTFRRGTKHDWLTELTPEQVAALEEELVVLRRFFVD